MILDGITAVQCGHIKVPCYLNHCPSLRRRPPNYISFMSPRLSGYSLALEARRIPSLRGPTQFSGLSNSFLSGNALKVVRSPARKERNARSVVIPSATKNLFVYPPMTSKPKWWWRSLACAPYLLPFHLMWLNADAVYHLPLFMEKWDFLVNPFLDTVALLPHWIMWALICSAYYLVVRRKEWPHFLRFHIIMALLFENGYQAMAIACAWLPRTVFRGKLGTCFWFAVTFAQLYTVLECMRCALGGKYADVPVLSDTAYIHSDPNIF